MSEALVDEMPTGGWTTDDLDRLPVSNVRHELTDGALTMSPSRSNLHQAVSVRLAARLEEAVPEASAVASAVEIRFARQLTRIPDLMVVRSDEPGRHWFAPSEVLVVGEIESPGNHVEDRVTKPALYARFGIPYYWRIEPKPLRVTTYRLGEGDAYHEVGSGDRLTVAEPFALDLPLTDLLPSWARAE